MDLNNSFVLTRSNEIRSSRELHENSLGSMRGFSPGPPVFPSPQKPTFPNSNSIWNCQALYHEPLARVIAQALPVFDIIFDLHLHFTPTHVMAGLGYSAIAPFI